MSQLLTTGVIQGSLLNSNSAPTDITLDNSDIDENNEIGDVIGALSTTDPDTGDTFTYTLVEGEGDTDNSSFTIDGANLKAGEVFDYETKNSYSIRVQSKDSADNTFEKQFTITINDVAEPPDAAPTGLVLTVVDRTDIKLDWTDNATNEDGYKIERSLNGVDFAVIDTVVADTETYTDEDLDELTQYYYRVRAYKGKEYSEYTDIENETTGSPAFTITVDTTKAGSANDTFVLPTTGAGYDAYVDWGDGGELQNITGTPGNVTHQYASSGTYQIKITGTFPRIYFNDAGDKLKLLSIDNWGIIVWGSFNHAFMGCANMVGNYNDTPDLSTASFDMTRAFHSCTSFNGVLSNFNTANVALLDRTFYNVGNVLKQSFANWNIENVTSLYYFLFGCNINETGTTTNYDDTLKSFASQNVKTSLNTNFGTSKRSNSIVQSGIITGESSYKLIDSKGNFLSTVSVGNLVKKGGIVQYAHVTNVDSNTQLTVDADIFTTGNYYAVTNDDVTEAYRTLTETKGWTITDGGVA